MALKFYSDPRSTDRLSATIDASRFETSDVVVFLCAQWCGVCRHLMSELEQMLNQPSVAALHVTDWFWIDTEDAADELPNLDIETFPTVAVISGGKLRMLAPVLPERTVWMRTIQASLHSKKSISTPEGTELLALVSRLFVN